jgi:hypothetical protein
MKFTTNLNKSLKLQQCWSAFKKFITNSGAKKITSPTFKQIPLCTLSLKKATNSFAMLACHNFPLPIYRQHKNIHAYSFFMYSLQQLACGFHHHYVIASRSGAHYFAVCN